MKYENLVKDILKHVGGKENIISVQCCVTRLRFKLRDENIANTQAIKDLSGVVTVMKSGGQYQVVIGNHVSEVYQEFISIAGISADEDQGKVAFSGNFLDNFIDIVSGVFQPIVGILCATGMIKGFLALFVALGILTPTSGTYIILYAVSDTIFTFMPIFLGYTTAKKFGLNQFVGMAIGAALVHPSISAITGEPLNVLFEGTLFESNVLIEFLGLPVIIPIGDYTSTVIPVIFAVIIAAPFERWLKKIIPSVVRTFLVPFFTLLIIVPFTFLVVGPIATWLGMAISAVISVLYSFSPMVAGALLGGFWQVLVIFGLHWGIIPTSMINIAQQGADPILAMVFGASFAQTGAVLAILLKTKDKKLKSIAIPAFISGIFGVTEPAIYGITLGRIKVFIASCIAAAIGGALLGLFRVKLFMFGGLGIFGYASHINPNGPENYFILVVVISLISFLIGLVLSYIVYNEKIENNQVVESDSKILKRSSVIYSPIKGEIISLNDVKDEAFSSKAIGKGVGIIAKEGKIYAPDDGTVTSLFPTKHAIGFTTDEGIELLIHIGINTVQLNGKYFTEHVKQGDKVKKGQLLKEFDIDAITNEGYSIVTPFVVANCSNYLDVTAKTVDKVNVGDELMFVVLQ